MSPENRKQGGKRRRGARRGQRRELPDAPPVSAEARLRLEKSLDDGEYIVFDIESTGGNPEKNGITEIFAIRYIGGEPKDTFYSLVNPGIPIPPIVRRMTGINNQMVRNAPRIADVMPGFVTFIGTGVLVSHNTIGDMKFVRYFAKQTADVDLENFYLCTHLLVEKLAPEAPDKSLKGLAEHFQLAKGELHRAEADAYVTLDLFKVLVGRLKERNVRRIEEAVRLQGDLESGMRLGWGVKPGSLESLPNTPGVFYLHDHDGRLLFFSSAMNVAREVDRLSSLDQLPRQLLRLVLKSYEIKGQRAGNPYEAMLLECDDMQKHKLQFTPLAFHQRTVQALFIAEDQNGLRLGVGQLEEGTKYAFGPVRDRRIAGEILESLAQVFGLKTARDGLIVSREHEALLLAFFSGGLEKDLESAQKQKRAIRLWFKPTERRTLAERVRILKGLAAIKLPPRFSSLLDRSGLLVVPDVVAGGWQVHSLVASRPRAVTALKGDPQTKLHQGGYAKRLAEKIRRDLDTLEPAAMTAYEVNRINATLWWLFNGKSDGRFVPLAEIEAGGAAAGFGDEPAPANEE